MKYKAKITNSFQSIMKNQTISQTTHGLMKVLNFTKTSMKSWLESNDIEMYLIPI